MNKKLSDSKIKEAFKVIRLLCGPMRFKIILLLKENKLVTAKKIDREVFYTLKDHRIRKTFPFY